MLLFIVLCLVGVAIGGITAFVIFWPLSLVHLGDRHPQVRHRLGEGAFLKPNALGWLLSGRYREVRDQQFTGLATPARIAAFVVVGAALASTLLWFWSLVSR